MKLAWAMMMVLSLIIDAGAQTRAFVSVSSPVSGRAVRVINVQTMTIESSLTNVGNEPSRMVANSDRSRIYLSSWIQNQGQVYAIDTRTRSVLAMAPAGTRQNRAIAISPDGQRVYTFRGEGSAPDNTIGILVLNAASLTEIVTIPITGANCTTSFTDIVVVPDGRVVANICTDGLRVIDPVNLTVSVRGSNSRLLGVAPDGLEIYASAVGSVSAFGSTGVRTVEVSSGTSTNVTWNVSGSSFPGFGNAQAIRATVVPGNVDPLVFMTYFDPGFANAATGIGRTSSLMPPSRQLTAISDVGTAAIMGVDETGRLGLVGRPEGIKRIRIDPQASGAAVISADSAILALPGLGTISDIIVLGPLFADGFE